MGNFTFAQVPTAQVGRSVFNRSHTHKTTFDAGYLIPFYVDEALPGDTFSVRASVFARLSTPIFPLMDNLYMDVHFFAVPNRIIWAKWVKMMGERVNPADSIDYQTPIISDQGNQAAIGSLFDYMGIPTGVPMGSTANRMVVNTLPLRAYARIFNDWYRDQNLQDSYLIGTDTSDGPDTSGSYVLKKRNKRHDYFTSCLPWPQKGATAVTLPLGTSAPVISAGLNPGGFGTNVPSFKIVGNATSRALESVNTSTNVTTSPAAGQTGKWEWDVPNLMADLTTATAATINQLREAFMVQKLLERDARGGTRYVELIKMHFGVVSPDFRMQRAEYLGGGTVPVVVNPVSQTSSTDATTPQGHLAGYGTAAGRGLGFTKSFTEHCYVLGIVSVRAEQTYQQGLPKMFSRRTRYDFFWPEFAHLGEQAVLNKEIFAAGTANDNLTFGYQERWAEYRYFPSKVTGKFRSADTGTLDSWHLANNFGALPTLNTTFIEEAPPMARVVAVTTEPHFLFDSSIAIKAVRPLPTYSVPGLGDRF